MVKNASTTTTYDGPSKSVDNGAAILYLGRMTPTLLNERTNGNTVVRLFSDGTKHRVVPEDVAPQPVWPESMDCKITNYCDNPICAKWCHEMSNASGSHADLVKGLLLLEDFPAGSELAIGGGNPLAHPDLEMFVKELSRRGVVCNLTVNSFHLSRYADILRSLIDNKYVRGVGISYFKKYLDDCDTVVNYTPNSVFHVIMGVHTVDDLQHIVERYKNPKVLLLGYKQYGNGASFFGKRVESVLYEWYTQIFTFFNRKGLTLSFDNLAISQLNLQRFFPDGEWEKFYMGDDGTFTMFLDLVERKYTTSSTSNKRYDILDTDTVENIFKKVKK